MPLSDSRLSVLSDNGANRQSLRSQGFPGTPYTTETCQEERKWLRKLEEKAARKTKQESCKTRMHVATWEEERGEC